MNIMKVKTIRPKSIIISTTQTKAFTHHSLSKPLKRTHQSKHITKTKKQTHHPQSVFGSEVMLPDAGNQPTPTPEQIKHINQRNIVDPIVERTLKENPQDVLHGSRSLHCIIPHYSRKPNDWDIFSTEERERAIELERKIDEQSGANVAQTYYRHIPSMPFSPPSSGTGEHLYRVTTPHLENEADIDIMNRPQDIETVRKDGITHESLLDAHKKATTRRFRQPLMMQKASSDISDIERYWKKKGKRTRI
jgi:hypothetical protein